MRLTGIIPFGIEALTSMRHGETHVIEPGAFGPPGPLRIPDSLSAGVFLLLGYDYASVLASTASGTLDIRVLEDGLEWRTETLPVTDVSARTRVLLRAGLIGGAIPGYVPEDVVREELTRGVRTIIRRGALCEINLVSRPPGDGSTVKRIRTAPDPRRRRTVPGERAGRLR